VKKQRGFTLVELMVTLVISVIGLLGVLAMHTSLTRGISATGDSQEAIAFGARTIESLRAMRVDQMTAAIAPSATAPPFTASSYATSTGRTGTAYSADVEVTEVVGTAGLLRIRVEVAWTEGRESHRIPFEVLRTTRDSL
jgi:prepilin-type N-terminal cleavage/methylation domain-containing protein